MTLTYATSDAPHMTIARCSGDLTLVSVDQKQVVVMGDVEERDVERQGESFTVNSDGDCDIQCPAGASVTIKLVSGDLDVQGVAGPLAIEMVSGDAELRDVGPTMLRQVSGDLQVRGVNGELRINSVSGDVKLRDVSGVAVVDSVRGDLVARDLESGATVKSVSGDVSLSTLLADGASYQFEARGDISAKVEVGEGGARCVLEGGDLHCRLPLQTTERSPRRIVGTLGEGKAELILRARGDLAISDLGDTWGPAVETEFESAMENWSQQFESHMADMQRKLEERLTRVPYVDDEHIARRAQEAAERARRQAERTAERARARAERAREHTERMKQKHGQPGRGLNFVWTPPSTPRPPRPPAEPISDSERMAILKMVADKKITADEASKLLAAMEGEA